MTIKTIKNQIKTNLGKEIKIKLNGSRNKIEYYNAVLKDVYENVFTVQIKNDYNELKSFSYSDVLTNTLEISFDEVK